MRGFLELITVALLAATVWMAFTGQEASFEQAGASSVPPNIPLPKDIAPLDATEIKPLVERPLFFPGRRALPARPIAAKAAPVVEAVSPPPQGYALRGAVVIGELRLAIIEHQQTAKYLRLGEGQSLESWILARVETDKAVFTRQQQTWTLEIAKPR